MKYLKSFKSIMEQQNTSEFDEVQDPAEVELPEIPEETEEVVEPTEEIPQDGTYAETWVSSANPEGDYDVTWQSEAGETVTASFRDTGGPLQTQGNGLAYSVFETIPGTASDGNEYVGEVSYQGEEAI